MSKKTKGCVTPFQVVSWIAIAIIFDSCLFGCSASQDVDSQIPIVQNATSQDSDTQPDGSDKSKLRTTEDFLKPGQTSISQNAKPIDDKLISGTLIVPDTGTRDVTLCVDEASPGRPIDVNIPDDTVMQPGQEFNKTWRLINAGTCNWTTDYQVFWLWGEKMGVVDSFNLPKETLPGESVDITARMIAPEKSGTYQSNWKLRDPDGKVFGVGSGEGLYFYARIIVIGTPLPNSDIGIAGVLNTPTPFSGGPTRLLPEDRIDLDNNQLNPSEGADIAMDSDEPFYLVPFEGAFLSIYGTTQPTERQCLSTEPSKTPIEISSLKSGTYLCYLTNQGRSGWMRIQNFWTFQNRALLNIEVYTWPLP